ncbi:MAG: class III poly(R)-hydroxyalkanoic acid synthase subunit PhaC [Gammaproteobacteria bacterium]|nr:class III poly(R)-hydroxyalkanoic acid synthase subunit PhaC [Gammaproteobacteria bacterium]
MPSLQFTAEDLQRELADIVAKRARAAARLREWNDAPPAHAQREVVLTRGKLRLFRYRAAADVANPIPVLIVYALVNRPYMVDLMPGCSLISELLARGLEVYLIDWGYPDIADTGRTLADYITGDLDACVELVRSHHAGDAVNLLSICQGGTFSLCYSALNPDKVKGLVTTVTPVDFQTPDDLLSHLLRHVDVDALVDAWGNIPGELMNAVFLAQKPFKLGQQKYADFVEAVEDDAASAMFLAMEKWIFDSPALAGAAFREFAQGCYQRNALIKGELCIGSNKVCLSQIVMPVLNLFAARDHLVPPAASRALAGLVGSADYTERELPGGHIGIYVSERTRLADSVTDWLRARTEPVGSTRGKPRRRRTPKGNG